MWIWARVWAIARPLISANAGVEAGSFSAVSSAAPAATTSISLANMLRPVKTETTLLST